VVQLLAALMALGCALACARRLWFVANPTLLHPEEVVVLVRREGAGALALLGAIAEREPGAEWERELLSALGEERPELRAALVNEQLTELDRRLKRWARVPRVCASVASSFAFLLATLVLRRGLVDAGEMVGEVGELVVRGLIGDAVTVVALGMAGTVFCIAAQSHAQRLAKARTASADAMVDALERAAAGGAGGAPQGT
jgi:hypothetical protein